MILHVFICSRYQPKIGIDIHGARSRKSNLAVIFTERSRQIRRQNRGKVEDIDAQSDTITTNCAGDVPRARHFIQMIWR